MVDPAPAIIATRRRLLPFAAAILAAFGALPARARPEQPEICPGMQPFTFWLTDEQAVFLRQEAAAMGTTPQDMLQRAIVADVDAAIFESKAA